MVRHSVILLFIIMLMLCCSEPSKDYVSWQPDQPKAGESVTITFTPQRLISADNKENQIFMIYQCLSDHDARCFRLPMKSRGKSWQATINCEPGTLLLRLKFEDSLDRVEDNDGYGWTIILRDNSNKVPRNSYYRLGRILSQKRPLSLASHLEDARRSFQTELSQYPDNYQCWFDLWSLRLKNSSQPQSEIAAIKSQLDSLLQDHSSSPELLSLAFECNWKLLNEPQKAIEFGQKVLAMRENVPHKDAIDYGMILLTFEQSPPQLIEGLIRFVQRAKDPESLRPAYYQLGLFFQNLQMVDQAIYYFSKYVELVPDEIPIWLNLANLLIRNGSYDQAREAIQRAKQLNTPENYLLSHVWETPEERANQLIMNQCQILSTLANLETNQGNHRAAIQYRRQALGLGTPFPDFECTQIGNL
ncbi:MAG: tetratricopeptide repeat protein, partial [candidate division KSB1 bacterium]|nr:tetratricopeptide repeat protein [candidate division KSB1 bacterium]